jgi:predicted kinase
MNMKKSPLLIIISGFPGTGKTTLSRNISLRYNLPLVCADELKELMSDRIGKWDDFEIFDSVSKAAYDLVYHMTSLILSTGKSCIIEAFLLPEMAEPRIADLKKKYNCRIFQLQLRADAEKIIERYKRRHESGERHPCHPGNIPVDEFIEQKGKSKKVNVDGETILLDTTDFKKIDYAPLFNRLDKLLQ